MIFYQNIHNVSKLCKGNSDVLKMKSVSATITCIVNWKSLSPNNFSDEEYNDLEDLSRNINIVIEKLVIDDRDIDIKLMKGIINNKRKFEKS